MRGTEKRNGRKARPVERWAQLLTWWGLFGLYGGCLAVYPPVIWVGLAVTFACQTVVWTCRIWRRIQGV